MYDVTIIGAGPTGASAALFAAKAGKKTLVIDNDKSVTKRALLKNHYGVEEITGPQLLETGKKQASAFGAEFVTDTAVNAVRSGEGFKVETESGKTYETKHLILASGFSLDLAEKLGVATKPGTEPRVKTVVDADAQGKSSITGVWAAGTVAGMSVHTIITAGDGAKVAINVISELNGERYVDHDMMQA